MQKESELSVLRDEVSALRTENASLKEQVRFLQELHVKRGTATRHD